MRFLVAALTVFCVSLPVWAVDFRFEETVQFHDEARGWVYAVVVGAKDAKTNVELPSTTYYVEPTSLLLVESFAEGPQEAIYVGAAHVRKVARWRFHLHTCLEALRPTTGQNWF